MTKFQNSQINLSKILILSCLVCFASSATSPAIASSKKASKEKVSEGKEKKSSEKKQEKSDSKVVIDNKKSDKGASQEAKDKVIKETKRPIKDKWAVVIGVNQFKDKTIPRLRFAAKDAKDFAKFLVESGNFAKDHVLLLLDKDATKHNIMASLTDKWLPQRVLPDDLVVIYASTHGSPKEIDRGGDNFLIAHDTAKDELYTTAIRLKTLSSTVKERTECDRIVLILDACNSGAAKAGGKGLFRSSNFNAAALAGKGQIVISSSDADQRSWESKRYKNGVFTRSLIDILSKSKETDSLDLETTFDKLKDNVQSEVRFDRKAFQTPVMHSKWEGDPLKITAKPVAPRAIDTADSASPYTYEKVLYRLAHPPKPVVKKAPPKPIVVPVKRQAPPVVVQPSTPQIIEQPAPKSKPIIVPAGKTADAWYKYRQFSSGRKP